MLTFFFTNFVISSLSLPHVSLSYKTPPLSDSYVIPALNPSITSMSACSSINIYHNITLLINVSYVITPRAFNGIQS